MNYKLKIFNENDMYDEEIEIMVNDDECIYEVIKNILIDRFEFINKNELNINKFEGKVYFHDEVEAYIEDF